MLEKEDGFIKKRGKKTTLANPFSDGETSVITLD